MIEFIHKNLEKILTWCVGVAVVFAIMWFSKEPPEFIEEHGILTWQTVHVGIVLLICYGLTSKKPFWKGFTEDVEIRMEACEKRASVLGNGIEKIATIIDRKLEEAKEEQEFLNLRIKELEKELKILSLSFSDHTWDCHDHWECQDCGEINEDITTDSSGVGICNKCNMPTYFKNIKQFSHVSKNKPPIHDA